MSKTDAARALRVNPTTLWRYLKECPKAIVTKDSDEVVDFAVLNEFVTTKDLERKIDSLASGEDSKIEKMAKVSRARRQILQDQAFDGRTLFHADAIRIWDQVNRDFLKEVERWPRTFAPLFNAFVSDQLAPIAEEHPQLREHLGVDIAKFELWFASQQKRRVEELRRKLSEIIPKAIERAQAQA